ncbi:MAG TPA: hypothetical protein VGG83_10825 [Trebonia sp.]|jgi:hypothetical protein
MAELTWYRHRDTGGVHGFTLPLHEDLANQVKKGMLQPCPPPAPESVRSLILSPEQEEALAGADLKESKKAKRERLLAQLAELGDDDEDDDESEPTTVVASPGVAVAGDAPDDATPQVPRANRKR